MLAVFSQQAQNLIILAEDEARMLGRSRVEPEHLLLAFARRGNAKRLLDDHGARARDIHAAIVDGGGRGDDLVLGRVPWSEATLDVLKAAVSIAARRGERSPSSENVLLALDEHPGASALLRTVGIADGAGLVSAAYPPGPTPLSGEQMSRYMLRVSGAEPPRPGPIPPVFERYSDDARRAVRAASEVAALLEHRHVEPFHLLLGCVHVPGCLAARMLEPSMGSGELTMVGEAMERARMRGPNPAHQATGIYAEPTRRIVAEDALRHAYRRGHDTITTGHIVLAVLDLRERTSRAIAGSGAEPERIARSIERALPGNEHATADADPGWINFDLLLRMLAYWFQQIVPQGWNVTAAGRSRGIWARPPQPRSEADYRVFLDWIVERDEPPEERLVAVVQRALGDLQTAVVGEIGAAWPGSGAHGLPASHVSIAGDDVNPLLRVLYGDPEAPVVEMPQPGLVHMLVQRWD